MKEGSLDDGEGGDGGGRVRRASRCWGATSRCLDVQSPLAVSLSLLFSWGVIHLKVK